MCQFSLSTACHNTIMHDHHTPTVLGIISLIITLVFTSNAAAALDRPVEFNRDIRPILSENCYYCHGSDSDQRQADLRIDTFEGATADLGGYAALVPGDAANSEILVRMTSHDEATQMPPPDSNRSVSKAQIELVRKWIDQGGEYATHWAFRPVAKEISVPQVVDSKIDDASNEANPIDAFVNAALEEKGLTLKPPTEDSNWLRRIYLDMNGLPPTTVEQDRFVQALKTDPVAARVAAVDRGSTGLMWLGMPTRMDSITTRREKCGVGETG